MVESNHRKDFEEFLELFLNSIGERNPEVIRTNLSKNSDGTYFFDPVQELWNKYLEIVQKNQKNQKNQNSRKI